jgi:hypothetical protein
MRRQNIVIVIVITVIVSVIVIVIVKTLSSWREAKICTQIVNSLEFDTNCLICYFIQKNGWQR